MRTNGRPRTPPRLPGFDYRSPSAYFVTICTYRRQKLLLQAQIAQIVADTWHELPKRFPTLTLDAFVAMPNHLHFIMWLRQPTTSSHRASLNDMVGAYKSLTSLQYLYWLEQTAPERSAKLWQRGFYERVIRTNDELNAYRQYIDDNPRRVCSEA